MVDELQVAQPPTAAPPGDTMGAGPMPDLRWTLSTVQPADWAAQIEGAGGGFYHSPPGLVVAAPPGELLFCSLRVGGEVAGVALGVRRRCRFSIRPRHFDFPAHPAVAAVGWQGHAVVSLIEELKQLGGAEVSIYSFDTSWAENPGVPGLNGKLRQEYVVSLASDPEELARSFAAAQRRHLRRGEREGWILRELSGAEALAAISTVHESTADRTRGYGRSFTLFPRLAVVEKSQGGRDAPWGINVFAAYYNGGLLAAAMVGRGGRRGYYVVGGSTPDGYRRSAAAWLHWSIMRRLIERGFTTYNLGGSPGSPETASLPDDPHHGLFRFKTGLGAKPVRSRGGVWVTRPGHWRLHRIVELIRA